MRLHAVVAAPIHPGRSWLTEFSLSSIEQDILLLAVAPEMDLKYETLLAYLNNDITRKWPTFDVAMRVCAATADRTVGRAPLPAAAGELVS